MNPLQDENRSGGNGISFEIFTVMGHDMKSPLNAIESYLDIMQGRVLGDAIDPYIPLLEKCIARLHQMRGLITDVVDWSRIQSLSQPRMFTTIDLSKTARTILKEFLKEAQKRNIDVLDSIEDDITIEAAAREIELVFHHLIDNAIKFNHDNGSLRVTVKRLPENIAIQVTDTGIGMNTEEQSRIFHEFVRIKNKKTQNINGSGLGLAIVKKLVELNHGSLHLESEPDKGSTFTVLFS